MESDRITAAPLVYFGGYVAMPLVLDLPKQVTFNGMTFYAKDEYHCSLVCVKCIVSELIEKQGGEAEPLSKQILQEIEAARLQDEPVFIGYRDELRHVIKDDNQSIVIMVNIDGLSPIFERLRHKFNLEIPTQPTHVTLYSLIPNKGIGIPTLQVLEATHLIQADKLEQLKQAMNFERSFEKSLI